MGSEVRCFHSHPPQPESTDPHRRLGAHARHIAALLLRSSLTYQRVGSLRSSAQTHDLAHLATNSLGAYRWIRADRSIRPRMGGAPLSPVRQPLAARTVPPRTQTYRRLTIWPRR